MKPEHIEEAEKGGYSTLGPSYFSAREIAQRITEKFEAEQFKPLIEKFAKDFNDKLWQDVEFSLMSDTECNIQGDIWRDVDAIIEAILGGAQWALQRYVLADRINCETIRKTVAKLIPEDVATKRIEDLEREVADLKSTLKSYHNSY